MTWLLSYEIRHRDEIQRGAYSYETRAAAIEAFRELQDKLARGEGRLTYAALAAPDGLYSVLYRERSR